MVEEGYKQTEIGVIPEDWDVCYLHQVSKKITDGEHATPKRATEGYYLLSARNVHNGRIDLIDVDFVGADEYQRIRKRCDPDAGDVLISCSGTIGRVAVLPAGLECVMVRSAALIKPDKSKTDGYFVQYILQSRVGQIQIAQTLNQGAQANLFINHIEGLKVPLPPLPEQRSIAQALSDVDALIAALEKAIAKKRHLKTATMQQILTGKKRLPGFGEGKGYQQTEIGVIPEDWDVSQVSQVTSGHKQGYYTKERYVEHGTRLVRITDLYNPKIDYESMPMLLISDNDFEQYKISRGDFLFARSGAIGRYGIVEDDIDAIFGSYIIRFNFNKSKLLNSFFGYLFETQIIWRQLLSITQGSSNININAGNIKALKIPLPHSEEQRAIAAVLSDMDAEIAALETRLAKTQALKQGMMQQLLTGRVRLV